MATLQIAATIDSYMQTGGQKDTNFGASSSMQLGSLFFGPTKQYVDRPIANFDVSALAGAVITAARLRCANTGSNTGASKVYRCTRPASWGEFTVTWNKYDGVNLWTTEGGDFDAATPTPIAFNPSAGDNWTNEGGQYRSIAGLETFVADALFNRSGIVSIIIKNDDELSGAQIQWNSREASPPWDLVVDYTPADLGRRSAIDTHMGERRPVRPRGGTRPAQPTRPKGAHRP